MDNVHSDIKDLHVSNRSHSVSMEDMIVNSGITDVRKASSFTGVIADLREVPSEGSRLLRHYSWPNEGLPDPKTPMVVRSGSKISFVTHNKPSMVEFTVPAEALCHRGVRHSINDIALVWKKDFRKWLWKSTDKK